MKDIFISYRRTDSSDVTGRICDHLRMQLGDNRLFKDVDSIPLGSDFRKAIYQSVESCKVLLAIIGADWLEAAGEQGTPRINDPDDYVHLEIAAAIERGIPVIPVLVRNSQMPQERDLPQRLRDLAYRNAAPVRPDPDFRHDIDRLCNQITEYLSGSAGDLEVCAPTTQLASQTTLDRTEKPLHQWTHRAIELYTSMPIEARLSVAFAAIGAPAWFVLLLVSAIGAGSWKASIVPLSFLFAIGIVFNICGIVMALRGMKGKGGWQSAYWTGLLTNVGEALAIVIVLFFAWSHLGGF